MKNTFRIVSLPLTEFQSFFMLNDDELAQKSARRLVVDAKPGFPCRVSLEDAEIGEKIILVPFVHHDVDSPYRASGPIFVRENSKEARLAPGEVPEVVSSRTISLRAYDDAGMMLNGEVVSGRDLKSRIEELFANAKVSYLHLHNAGAGCYSCRVERVRD